MKKVGVRVLVGLLLLWGGLVMFNLFSKPAATLGVQDGKLAACPDSPNCVSTQALDDGHKIDAISYTGEASAALTRIKAALALMPRIQIVTEEPSYLHATATTALMRYVDDVEFFIDEPGQVIHFRSASRIGYSDLGANRKRMEKFRGLFNEQP